MRASLLSNTRHPRRGGREPLAKSHIISDFGALSIIDDWLTSLFVDAFMSPVVSMKVDAFPHATLEGSLEMHRFILDSAAQVDATPLPKRRDMSIVCAKGFLALLLPRRHRNNLGRYLCELGGSSATSRSRLQISFDPLRRALPAGFVVRHVYFMIRHVTGAPLCTIV